jgi:hypothetical protein|tara:strand:- start:8266 stop:8430 length:165 start_codon:yes stop_codon:yes gene_type:complete
MTISELVGVATVIATGGGLVVSLRRTTAEVAEMGKRLRCLELTVQRLLGKLEDA